MKLLPDYKPEKKSYRGWANQAQNPVAQVKEV